MAGATPQWTTELREQTSGLDHLGLGSVSNVQTLARLVPDLYVLTVHPGYNSFYSFVLDEFWRRDNLPRTRNAWRTFFRAKELIFSIACNTCEHPDYEGEFAIIPGSATTLRLAIDPPTRGYDTDFNYIKSAFGGYGLYYRSIMASMGLIYLAQDTKYPIDVPTDRGKDLAQAFRERIEGTSYYKSYFDKERVPTKAVSGYGTVACLCRLRDAATDLDPVRDVLMHGGLPFRAAGRRASLRMVLDIAAATAKTPLDQIAYRQLIYYGSLPDGAATWRPSTTLPSPEGQMSILETWRRWRVYQAREFYAYALDGLWRWLVDWGIDNGGESWPIPESEAVAALIESLNPSTLAESLGITEPKITGDIKLSSAIRDLRRLAGEPDVVPANDPDWPDRPFHVDADLTEWDLYVVTKRGVADGDLMASACLALLLLTASRFDYPLLEHRDDWEYARLGGTQRLSLDRFISALRKRTDAGQTIADLARWLLEDYVIAQHLRVAASKLPYNTYRFVREGNALRFFDRTRPIDLNSARFVALSNTVSDLGFVGPLALKGHKLTAPGKAFLENGDWEAE